MCPVFRMPVLAAAVVLFAAIGIADDTPPPGPDERVLELNKSISTNQKAGRMKEAVAACEQLLNLQRDTAGKVSDDALETQRKLAWLYESEGAFPAALEQREELLELLTKEYGEKDWRTVDARLDLDDSAALSRLDLKQFKELRDADELYEKGVRHLRRGKYAESLNLLIQCLKTDEEILGKNHRRVGKDCQQMALAYKGVDEPGIAESNINRAIAIQTLQLGEAHPELANSYNRLGIIQQYLRQYDDAIASYVKAGDIWKAAFGDKSGEYSTCLINLAGANGLKGDNDQAEQLLRDALAIQQSLAQNDGGSERLVEVWEPELEHDDEGPQAALVEQPPLLDGQWDFSETLAKLGLLLSKQKRYDEAEPLLLRARELSEQYWGSEHPRYLWNLIVLAGFANQRSTAAFFKDDFAGANEFGKQELGWTMQRFGDDHYRATHVRRKIEERDFISYLPSQSRAALKEATGNLGKINGLIAKKKLDEALDLAQKAWVTFKTYLGENSTSTISAEDQVANLLIRKGKLDEAEAHLQSVWGKRRILYGDDPGIEPTRTKLATLHQRQVQRLLNEGKYDAAISECQKEISLWTDVYGDKHWRTIEARVRKIDAERMKGLTPEKRDLLKKANDAALQWKSLDSKGNYRESVEALQQAYDFYVQSVGPTDSTALTSLIVLGVNRERLSQKEKAEECFQVAWKTRKEILGEDHPLTAIVAAHLGHLISHQTVDSNAFDRAEKLLIDSIDIQRRTTGKQNDNYASALNGLGWVYAQRDDPARAEMCYREAQIIWQRLGNHQKAFGALNNLSILYKKQHDYARAEAMLRRVIEHHEKTNGSRPNELATSLLNLSNVLHEQRKLTEAVDVRTRGIEIRRKAIGPKAEATSVEVTTLTDWYSQLSKQRMDEGDFDGARQLKQKEIELASEYFGEQSLSVRKAKIHLREISDREKLTPQQRKQLHEIEESVRKADRLVRQQKRAEAKKLFEAAYYQAEPIMGSKDPLIANLTNRLGDCYRADKRFDLAERMYRIELAAVEEYFGVENPRHAACLADLASVLEANKDFVSAEKIFKDSLVVLKKDLTPRDRRISDLLTRIIRFYERWGNEQAAAENLNAAAVAYRQAFEFATERYDRRPNEAWRITDLRMLADRAEGDAKRSDDERKGLQQAAKWVQEGNDFRRSEKNRDASAVLQQAVDAYLRVLGREDRRTVDAQFILAMAYDYDTDYAAAEPIYRTVLEWRTRVLGEHHPDTAAVLKLLGSLEMNRHTNYEQAEKLLVKARDIFIETTEKDSDQIALTLLALAQVSRSTDRLARAEELGRQAQEALLKTNHDTRALFANIARELGTIYLAMGDYARSEAQLHKAIEVFRIVYGDRSLSEAKTTIQLGQMYAALGDQQRANAAYRDAHAIYKEVVGEQHRLMTHPLNLLGDAAMIDENLDQAEKFYGQALEIQRQYFGLTYATCLSKVATTHIARKEYGKAEALLTEAFEIRKSRLPMQNGSYVNSLIDFAHLREQQDHLQGAADYLNQALEIYARQLGHRHPKYVAALRDLSRIERKAGRIDNAVDHLNQCVRVAQTNLLNMADSQSERQQLLLTRSLRQYLDDYLSLAFSSKAAGTETYSKVLTWKGTVFARQLHARELNAARIDADDVLLNLYKKLEEVTTRLARSRFAISETVEASTRAKQTKELNEELERIESELAKRSADFRGRKARESLTPAQLQECLPDDAAMIDFLEYRYGGPDEKDAKTWISERRCAAFVIRKGQAVQCVDLGPDKPVNEAVDLWLAALQRKTSITGEDDPAIILRKLIWNPLVEHLKGANTVLISPDGRLCRVPFAALPGDEPGSYLIEQRALSVIPVPQLLPEMLNDSRDFAPETSELLLMGNVDYGEVPVESAEQSKERSSRTVHPIFRPLESTAGEVLVIKKHFEKRFRQGHADLMEEDEATTREFHLKAPRYHWLHLATHGFFGSVSNPDSRGATVAADDDEEVATVNPGLLSGLAMAGVNSPTNPDEDDGILTALEVAQLDLRKVQLAVLSACETGLGQNESGEGVLGLQRAFQVAGAKGVVASLWSVDDNATRTLMERFYENLWKKRMPRLQAMREAQLWMLKEGKNRGMHRNQPSDQEPKPTRTPPYYWAPFVLSGDWR